MLASINQYINSLVEETGTSWNRFFYQPSSGVAVAWLRQAVASVAFVWLATYTMDIHSMFGATGWLSNDVIHQATTNGDLRSGSTGFSHLFWITSDSGIWICHLVAVAIAFCAAIGFRPRLTTPLTLLVTLCYVHRSPITNSAFEAVLCMLLAYSCLGPKANLQSIRSQASSDESTHWLNTVALRLIQLHTCGIYLLIATSKLGTPDWWSGAALWYLMSDQNQRLIGLDFLANNDYVLDALAHAWVAFELAFPVLVWNRLLRPMTLVLSALFWLLAAISTGQIGYCLLMVLASLAFCQTQPD
jgi:hypothetical protein